MKITIREVVAVIARVAKWDRRGKLELKEWLDNDLAEAKTERIKKGKKKEPEETA